VVPVEVREMSDPLCVRENDCELPVNPFREVMPAPAIPTAFHDDPL
jgi:hypothetical protein